MYTVDIDLSMVSYETDNKEVDLDEDLTKKMEKIKKNREKRKKLYEDAISGKQNIWKDFVSEDLDFQLMRSKFTPEFYDYYDSAIKCYLEGNWTRARELFEKANIIVESNDGPIQNFLSYMHTRNYIPDPGWNGVKEEEHDGH